MILTSESPSGTYSRGFQLIINSAWNLLNTVIIPSGSFGSHGDITFMNILMLGLGGLILVKFVRFCMGGNFNSFHDKYKPNTKPSRPNDINNFMHSDDDAAVKELESLLLKHTGNQWK